MFDRLIESNSKGTNTGDRRGYFAVSTFFMSLVLIAGLLTSIFAANFDIGNGDLDVSQLLAPLETNAPEPEPAPKTESQQEQNRSNDVPMRTAAIQQISETPNRIVPVATTPVEFKERPDGRFEIGKFNVDRPNAGSETGIPDGTSSNAIGESGDGSDASVSTRTTTPAPPALKKVEPKKDMIVSLGVVNGKAKALPPPPYPPAAKAVGAGGTVQVQITIDTDGSVISSRAISGHPLLRKASEDAARRARFSPTLLSNQPVKATGVISYNFVKS